MKKGKIHKKTILQVSHYARKLRMNFAAKLRNVQYGLCSKMNYGFGCVI